MGAYTGEVTAEHLKDLGINWAIIGIASNCLILYFLLLIYKISTLFKLLFKIFIVLEIINMKFFMQA